MKKKFLSVVNSGWSNSFHSGKKENLSVQCSEKSQWNFTIAKLSNFCESRAGQIIQPLFLSKIDGTDQT